jgi:nitroimidazol reductase NimA-like FMN-containing flavoprotein (pyridoxamine 5'-phosphate oxidase superfamily)
VTASTGETGEEGYPVGPLNRVRQLQERGCYDRATVFDILDRGLVAHVAFIDEGQPVVIPMAYGRDGDRLYLHGSRKARIVRTVVGTPVSIGVTLVDGIVAAGSLFESSMNYRAVVIHGIAVELMDPGERLRALRAVSEHSLPGRWDELGEPSGQELKATTVLAVTIEAAAAKIRRGPASTGPAVGDASQWTGVIPVVTTLGNPLPDPTVQGDVAVPPSIVRIVATGPEPQ